MKSKSKQISQAPLALALGGGGSKTFAHLGVLDALRQHDILINQIVTCSSASVMAVLYLSGWSSQQIIHQFGQKRHWWRLATGSLFSYLLSQTTQTAGVTDLAELKPALSIVSVDLKTGQPVVFQSGDPVKLALASSAFPGLLPAVKYGQYYLIDGGSLNPDPADIARQQVGNHGMVLTVSLRLEYPTEKPGNRLNTLLKSLYLLPYHQRVQVVKNNSDMVLTPLSHLKISFTDWKETFVGYCSLKKMQYFYQQGYQTTIKHLPQIQQLLSAKTSHPTRATSPRSPKAT